MYLQILQGTLIHPLCLTTRYFRYPPPPPKLPSLSKSPATSESSPPLQKIPSYFRLPPLYIYIYIYIIRLISSCHYVLSHYSSFTRCFPFILFFMCSVRPFTSHLSAIFHTSHQYVTFHRHNLPTLRTPFVTLRMLCIFHPFRVAYPFCSTPYMSRSFIPFHTSHRIFPWHSIHCISPIRYTPFVAPRILCRFHAFHLAYPCCSAPYISRFLYSTRYICHLSVIFHPSYFTHLLCSNCTLHIRCLQFSTLPIRSAWPVPFLIYIRAAWPVPYYLSVMLPVVLPSPPVIFHLPFTPRRYTSCIRRIPSILPCRLVLFDSSQSVTLVVLDTPHLSVKFRPSHLIYIASAILHSIHVS